MKRLNIDINRAPKLTNVVHGKRYKYPHFCLVLMAFYQPIYRNLIQELFDVDCDSSNVLPIRGRPDGEQLEIIRAQLEIQGRVIREVTDKLQYFPIKRGTPIKLPVYDKKLNNSTNMGIAGELLYQAGGKRIKLRTFHLLKSDKYSEKAFRADKPKIAAENVYEFLKTHYKIGNKKIRFTIEDRKMGRRYVYFGRTRKMGDMIIKSANI